ncbi:Tc toxin subunit A [Pseudomonas sp. GL-RE-19]|uniref:Tc toxin subunit A n=1 Tax=Pseudomonas sp. GL-RE-19 TaxID=2832389 RepID=UPI001CBB9041|nr:Tc toxin subunit A [Pseudomonas sp. GL-RE-19]
MAFENNSLINSLVAANGSPKKGRSDFATAMQKMGFTSVFDIVRLSRSEFARQLAVFSDANADLAYDNAMGYAALIARLYREYKTSSGKFQHLAQRSGVRPLTMLAPTFPNLFKENWDEFCKVGAIAAVDSPVAYLSELRGLVRRLEEASTDPERLLLDRRRPDLKDLLITQESTFTPRPMLEIVNDVLTRNLQIYLSGVIGDANKSIYQVLTERRYPFGLPYNFYHQQCAMGLVGNKPTLGEFNYRASLLLPIAQDASNHYGTVQQPALQAQRLLSGLSPQQQNLLIEPSPFSNFYLTRDNLNPGWQSPGSSQLSPHSPMKTCNLLPTEQTDIGTANPLASTPATVATGTTSVPVTFRKPRNAETEDTVTLQLSTGSATNTGVYRLNSMHNASSATICSRVKSQVAIPKPNEEGYSVSFDLHVATGTVTAPVRLIKRRFTLTLDEHYHPTEAEKIHFIEAYGVAITDSDPTSLANLNEFMQHTGLNAEQVEMVLAQRTYAVRLSPNCPSKNLQSAGVINSVPFPHANHYGACYVNGTGSGLYDSVSPPTPNSILRDKYDNSMNLVQVETGGTKIWRLTKTSLNRFDRLQRMIRLQRWTGIPFAKLDTLIISVIRAEGEANLGMELNENTLRALGVYRHLNQRHGIDPLEFAALIHDLTPYASGKDEVPLFDQVFNRVQLFDTPLILDQTVLDLDNATPANQKTLLQLCAGLGLQPTEDSLLLIAKETKKHLKTLKRDLPTVSSLFRQARIAQLFGLPVADLLTLAHLLGGGRYKQALTSGLLKLPTTPEVPDILDVLMQLDWAVDWLKDSQQTIAQLQQRLGPFIPQILPVDEEGSEQHVNMEMEPPLSDDLLKRLNKLHNDALRSVVTQQQVTALDLPAYDDAPTPVKIQWISKLVEHNLLGNNGLLYGLDQEYALVHEPHVWLRAGIDELLKTLNLTAPVKEVCAQKLLELLLDAHDRQTQLVEDLFQETAKLPSDRTKAVIHWAYTSIYSILADALEQENTWLIQQFQNVSRHAEIALQLRLSDSALRLFAIHPDWLGGDPYPETNSKPSLADLYLFERLSHWLHAQRQSEDSVLSYFPLANPAPKKLQNKALRQVAAETANGALARLLEWPEKEIEVLTGTLEKKRACSMAQVDWVRRCQAVCQASGLSAKALLQATELHDQSTLDDWKAVGDAVMAANNIAASSSLANV